MTMRNKSVAEESAPRVVLIDDDRDFLAAQEQGLKIAGFGVQAFSNGPDALRHISADFDGVVLSDIRMPNMDGLSLFRRVQEIDPELPVILLTGHGDVPMAVQALKSGAYDFLTKPFPSKELMASLQRASLQRQLVLENRRLRKTDREPAAAKTLPLGESAVMRSLRQVISQIADADVDVLITGDTGTGKKTVARALHGQSNRRNRPLVQISCASLHDERFHAELFGEEMGAKQLPGGGSARRTVGRLEKANKGAVLLDDIDGLSLQQQATLLGVMETRESWPAGAEEPRALDIRIMATTRCDLRAAVQDGRFRADLFYLLNGITLHVPPLRERRGDIRLLFQHFLVSACSRMNRPIPKLSMSSHTYLQLHSWPGNVRELERFAESVALGLEEDVRHNADDDGPPTLSERVHRFEAEIIRDTLTQFHGNVQAAMRALRIARKTFYDKLARHEIRIADYRNESDKDIKISKN